MIILTAANSEHAKDLSGNPSITFSFKDVIEKTVLKALEYGYVPKVYDLGQLGIGEKFTVIDETFNETGFYKNEPIKGYRSKSLFKPDLVDHCIDKYDDFVVYLDGDALLCSRIDEIQTGNYDIGVTLRDSEELEGEWHQQHFEIIKYVNAGVIFFNNTPATKQFVKNWKNITEEVGNDQMALNRLVCPSYYPEVGSIHELNGIKIKYFSGKEYNFYYFAERLPLGIKIFHFKGDVRHFYPFTPSKRIYCLAMVLIAKRIKSLIKKMTRRS